VSGSIEEWLAELGLEKYVQEFSDNEITLEALPHISEADLKEIGVALGARRILMAAIGDITARDPPSPATKADSGGDARPEAERRPLTVMFCDMVGSTALAEQLDPEDMRELIRRYQNAVSGAIARYEGHVAKFLGDGVLAYFGWPQAHEDQAHRAIHAGLEAAAATADINADDQPLAARVGIATGLVVVGDLAGESDAIVGETPNLAARLQALAEPGQVVIGPTTQRLVTGAFEMRDLGGQTLKGFAEPIDA
jgi:class 3 adenylate cyclase